MTRFPGAEILKSRGSGRPQPPGTSSGPGRAPCGPDCSPHARPTTAGQAGGNQQVRIKLAKSLTVLAAMAVGAGTAMAGTTAATAAPAKPCVTDANLVP